MNIVVFSKDSARQRGSSLPTVIMVVALMMMLAFTVVAIAFNHLNLTFRSSNNAKAELLAEAVLALAIEKAAKDVEHYGLLTDQTIELELEAYSGGKGVLSFDKSKAASLGVPYSTNNRSESSIEGSNTRLPVPGQSLHLVARAEVNGAYSTMETILHIPKFPYSIASNGAIRSNGGLLVASLKPGVPYDLSLPVHEEDLEAGHLVSNSRLGEDAIVMSGQNTITGDIRSASLATIDADTKVLGERRLEADPVPLDKLVPEDYNPWGASQGQHARMGNRSGADTPVDPNEVQTINSGAGTLNIKGYNVFGQAGPTAPVIPGNLVVDNGIELNGGVLFVHGDLTVTAGGVRGKGAIISTGKITIRGASEASTDNQAALIAQGDIALEGASSIDKAKFAGLIYTNGKISSKNVRLAGVVVATGGDEQDSVALENTELYYEDELAKQTLGEFELPVGSASTDTLNGFTISAGYDTSELSRTLETYRNPSTGPGEPEYLFEFDVSGSGPMTYKYDADGKLVLSAGTGNTAYRLDAPKLGLTLFGQKVTSLTHAEDLIIERYVQATGDDSAASNVELKRFAAKHYNTNSSQLALRFSQAAAAHTAASSGAPTVQAPVRWSVDLSQILSVSERMKVAYWGRFR